MKKWPVQLAAVAGEDHVGGVGHDLGLAALPRASRRRRAWSTAAVAITVRGQSALTAMPSAAELLGHAEHAQAHAVLGHGVGDVVREPLRVAG